MKLSARPSVSIVIPTVSGREDLLSRAISSVREPQLDIEIVVASTSMSPSLKALSHVFPDYEITLAVRDGLGTAAANRNRALNASSGEVVAFLDDDDEFIAGKLTTQVTLMQSTNVRWSFSNYLVCDTFTGEVMRRFSARSMLRPNLNLDLNCAIATPTVAVNRSLFTESSLRFDETLEVREDIQMWSSLLSLEPALYIPQALSVVHRGKDSSFRSGKSISTPRSIRRFIASTARLQRIFLDEIDIRFGTPRVIPVRRANHLA